uniref:RWP-RK domain-containing protein n=1 Tax=Globisporangium ultimum (strain ATCC 200006 / CBS 805.95 / DAOM BR144) TaxID=431595 RepID=K3WKF4_GLOUD
MVAAVHPMDQQRMAADFELAELQQYYHLPLREAARRLGSCEAVIKRVCRRKQIQRWPYRQVSSKLIKIQHLCKYMAHVKDPEQVARIQQKVKQLTQEYLEIVGGQVPSELQLSAAEAAMVPALPTSGSAGFVDPAEIASAVDDAADEEEMDEEIVVDDSDEPEDDKATASDDTATLSAYSLRFILSDCKVLETHTGVQLSSR